MLKKSKTNIIKYKASLYFVELTQMTKRTLEVKN